MQDAAPTPAEGGRGRTLLVAFVLLLPACAAAQPAMGGPPLFPYEKEGPFVIWPASFVAAPVYQIAFMAGSLVCLPGSLAQDARHPGEVPHERQASIRCGRGLGTALGWPVYAAAGLPFAALKGIFWDAPRAAAGVFRGKPKAEAAPASPPVVQ